MYFLFYYESIQSYSYRSDNSELVQYVQPFLSHYGVHAYFCGHDHLMEHLDYDGVEYFVTGASTMNGAIEDEGNTAANLTWAGENFSGFSRVLATAEELTVDFLDYNGTMVYSHSQWNYNNISTPDTDDASDISDIIDWIDERVHEEFESDNLLTHLGVVLGSICILLYLSWLLKLQMNTKKIKYSVVQDIEYNDNTIPFDYKYYNENNKISNSIHDIKMKGARRRSLTYTPGMTAPVSDLSHIERIKQIAHIRRSQTTSSFMNIQSITSIDRIRKKAEHIRQNSLYTSIPNSDPVNFDGYEIVSMGNFYSGNSHHSGEQCNDNAVNASLFSSSVTNSIPKQHNNQHPQQMG